MKSSLGVSGSSAKDREVREFVFGRNSYLFVDGPEVGGSGRRKMGNLIGIVRGGVVQLKLVVRSLDS